MFRCSTIVLLFPIIFGGQGAPVHRDWAKYPAIVEVDTGQATYAIGDPHADATRLASVLVGAKLIAAVPQQPGDVNWTGGESVAVFTGDLIDKGPDSLAVIALVRALGNSAAKAGGRVIVTMGNHEAEFLADPSGQKTAEFAAQLTAAGMSPNDVAACKGDLGGFLCGLPFAARVNDWFFSHAGNTAGRTLKKLSSDLAAGVDRDGFKTQQLIGDDSLLEARLGDAPWFEANGASAQTTLTAYCKALGVKHIVQGHQPGKVEFDDGAKRKSGELFQRYGLIFLEDTGMSQGVEDSHGAALFVSKDDNNATAICFDGTSTVIWDNGSHRDGGSIPPCGGK